MSIRIFVSHKESDKHIAKALVSYLQAALKVDVNSIR